MGKHPPDCPFHRDRNAFLVGDTVYPNTCETTLTALAPAKINLLLRVHGERADGFHSITSLAVGVELCDELAFTLCDVPGITLACSDSQVPDGQENLVVRAGTALAERVPGGSGARIRLRKRIPLGGGLGGGSSDCASTLDGLNRLWGAGLSRGELTAIGAALGSDVPLFFHLPAAVIRGRGERVEPAPMQWSGWVVLAFGGHHVSTRAVYANWREEDRDSVTFTVRDLLRCRRAPELGEMMVNELEPAVYRTVPEVRAFRAALEQRTHRRWRISGAGSTAFALFDHEDAARRTGEITSGTGLANRVAVVRTLSEQQDQLCEEATR